MARPSSHTLVALCFLLPTTALAQPPARLEAPPEPEIAVPREPTSPPPAHWQERRGNDVEVPPEHLRAVPPWAPIDFASLGDLYLRFDVGTHREFGFAERDGVGLEVLGRLRLPSSPWISVVGGVRNEFQDGSDRLTWTLAGFGEWDRIRSGGGIDGIFDNRTDTHVGSGFIFLSYELIEMRARVGVWSTFTLWDDIQVFSFDVAPGVMQVVRTGVEPYEQTSVFFSVAVGPEGRWGEFYVAPGFEHRDGRFRFSLGYQGTLFRYLDGFVHYHQSGTEERDWSIFAGLQLHFGCADARPFDFVMPQRIRARQMSITTVDYLFF